MHLDFKYEKILKQILAKYNYSFYLFGSRAKSEAHKYSDIDIFYLEDIPAHDLISLKEELTESDLLVEVDLVNYYDCDDRFKKSAFKNYEILQLSSYIAQVKELHSEHFEHIAAQLQKSLEYKYNFKLINSNSIYKSLNIVTDNHIIDKSLDAEIDSQIKDIKATFNNAFEWWLMSQPENLYLEERLLASGFKNTLKEDIMICDLDKSAFDEDEGRLTFKQLDKEEQLQDFKMIIEDYDTLVKNYKIDISRASKCITYIAYYNEKPVTTAQLYKGKSLSAIFSFTSLENERGKGYGTAMLRFLLKEAKKLNYRLITLTSSNDNAKKLYKKIGFRKLGEFKCYEP